MTSTAQDRLEESIATTATRLLCLRVFSGAALDRMDAFEDALAELVDSVTGIMALATCELSWTRHKLAEADARADRAEGRIRAMLAMHAPAAMN